MYREALAIQAMRTMRHAIMPNKIASRSVSRAKRIKHIEVWSRAASLARAPNDSLVVTAVLAQRDSDMNLYELDRGQVQPKGGRAFTDTCIRVCHWPNHASVMVCG